jgi:ribosomal protein S27AE
MPRLACFRCGRQLYTVAPIEALFAEERRCPRCGAFLSPERREMERRITIRRADPAGGAGPPGGIERRAGERRTAQRRRPAG